MRPVRPVWLGPSAQRRPALAGAFFAAALAGALAALAGVALAGAFLAGAAFAGALAALAGAFLAGALAGALAAAVPRLAATMSLKVAPTANFTPLPAGTLTAAPVRGLRAVRALRCVWLQPPKPGRETFSPFFTDCCTVLMKALITFSTSTLPMAVSFEICSTSWVLFTTTSRVNGCFNVESEPTNAGSSSTIFVTGQGELLLHRSKTLMAQGFSPRRVPVTKPAKRDRKSVV